MILNTKAFLPLLLACVIALLLSAPSAFGVAGGQPTEVECVLHVAPGGNDANPGSSQSPLRTLPGAVTHARAWRQEHPDANAVILLATGEYILDKPLVLTPQDSNLRIAAEANATPSISSGQDITGWKILDQATPGLLAAAQGKVWVADVPKGVHFQTMLVNGERATRSRSNKEYSWRKWGGMAFSFTPPDKDGRQQITFKDKELLKYVSSGGDAEMVYILAQYKNPGYGIVTDVDASQGTARVWTDGQVILLARGGRETAFRLENDISFIGEPGEWAINSALGKVYYWPKEPDISKLRIQYPRLFTLISIEGEEPPHLAHDISIEGITFTGTDRPRMGEYPHLPSAKSGGIASGNVSACLAIDNATSCLVDHCRFLQNGACNDVCIFGDFASHDRVSHCEMGWSGGSGASIKGQSPWEKDDHNSDNEISFNHIHNNGFYYWNAPGIGLENTRSNQVHHNYIEQSSYANISISGGMKPQLQLLLKDPTARRALFAQMAERDNIIQKNVCIEPCSYLEEGGSIYATSSQHDLYDQNLIYKSSAMPGSSVIAMDDVAEFSTITGNVIWLEGAPLNIAGMRAYTLETKVLGNIQCGYKPAYKSRRPSSTEKPNWYTKEDDLKSFNTLWKQIKGEADQSGGWPGSPNIVDSIQEAKSRRHITLTPEEVKQMHSVIE